MATDIMSLPKELTTEQIMEFSEEFEFLLDLRESGVTNMFGASPYLMEEFPELEDHEATRLLSLWMQNFVRIKDVLRSVKED